MTFKAQLVGIMLQDLDAILDRIEQQMRGANRDLIMEKRFELKRAKAHLDRLVKSLDDATLKHSGDTDAADHS